MATDGSYTVEFAPRAARDLRALARPIAARIAPAIAALAGDPRPAGCKRLTDRPGTWRIRVGDHRVIYEVHDDRRTVRITKVARRDDVYRK